MNADQIRASAMEEAARMVEKMIGLHDGPQGTIEGQIARAIRTAAALPDGHVLVPVEPTEEMLAAGRSAWQFAAYVQPLAVYRAMLEAAK